MTSEHAAAASATPAPGPTEREFVQLAQRYAPRIRAVVVCCCAVLAVLAMPVADIPGAAAVAAVALGWSAVHLRYVGSAPRPGLFLAADLAVLTGLCLSQPLTVPQTQTMHGNTWILVTVSIVVVAYQLTHPPLLGAVIAVYLALADLAGVMLDRPDAWLPALPNVGWLLVQAALTRGLYELVRRRGRAADAAADEAAEAQRQHDVAEARRAAEREHLATLHDTACATLLMASFPGPSLVRADVLRSQARRDLAKLSLAARDSLTDETDVARELAEELTEHPVRVRTRFDGDLGTLWRPAVTALRGALGEALRNVARHTHVGTATVTAHRSGPTVVVTVGDEGPGFDTALVPEHRRGLALSIIDRMSAVGGRATVQSRPGHGTVVRLEWPYAPHDA